MRVGPLAGERLAEFVQYCRKCRAEVDSSNINEEDLRVFQPDVHNPTVVLLGDDDQIIGAGSLLLGPEMGGRRGRIRILHASEATLEAYQLLFDALLPSAMVVSEIWGFVPERQKEKRAIFELLGFWIKRYSYFMTAVTRDVLPPRFPAEYEVRPFRPGVDEHDWCQIKNTCFQHLAGSTTTTPESLQALLTVESYAANLMLWHGDRPIGVVLVPIGEEEGQLEIGITAFSILPEYQGKGLGRNLLRAAIEVGRTQGIEKVWLSVHAENEKAAQLYLQEGFKTEDVLICYAYSTKEAIEK